MRCLCTTERASKSKNRRKSRSKSRSKNKSSRLVQNVTRKTNEVTVTWVADQYSTCGTPGQHVLGWLAQFHQRKCKTESFINKDPYFPCWIPSELLRSSGFIGLRRSTISVSLSFASDVSGWSSTTSCRSMSLVPSLSLLRRLHSSWNTQDDRSYCFPNHSNQELKDNRRRISLARCYPTFAFRLQFFGEYREENEKVQYQTCAGC